ncbi:MAG: CaiB/BaiF CoA-transferase family protein [Alcanivorax sp.]|nr:CaiB/BaiF CoA-transferase family protein [Alcanivorax sp.]
MTGPLHGLTFIELAGIGPGPFCGMMLADMGATVIRVDRPGGNPHAAIGHSILFRNRQNLAVDLKSPAGIETILRLCESADGLFEGFRPGVAERLGVGPEQCQARNPKLVYGRMTGWGQTGPLAKAAGHDMNYIALSGALHAMGRAGEKPAIPLNLVGDFGGGGMMLAFGMVCAALEAQRSGQGQVVDSSMVEGSAALMAMFYGLRAQGLFSDERGTHMLDSGAPFYEVYETADRKYVSIGSIEPQFYAQLCELAELPAEDFGNQLDTQRWPQMKEKLATVIRQKTREQWTELMQGTDVCFAPVLGLEEAPAHPHNQARESFVTVDDVVQPAPTPRFSRSGAPPLRSAASAGADTRSVLTQAGFSDTDIDNLIADGAVRQD